MQKITLLLFLLTFSAYGQEFIFIKDSTSYQQHRAVLRQKALTGDYKMKSGIVYKNEISAPGLSKRLSRELHTLTFSDYYLPYLNLVIVANPEGQAEKIYCRFVKRDTTRTGVRWEEVLFAPENTQLLSQVEEGIRSALSPYEKLPQLLRTSVNLNFPVKEYKTYLASLPDDTKTLFLENYHLKEVPAEIYRFKQLKSLNLKDNYIQEIKFGSKDFPNLENLSLQGNLMDENSGSIPKVKILNLIDNQYSAFPKIHKKTKDVLLATNYITKLRNSDLRRMKNLATVNLYLNRLTVLPKGIKKLKKVKELDLYRNALNDLPESLGKMKSLSTLAVSYNELQALPKSLKNLNKLEQLYAHHNRLMALPQLPNGLTLLDVGYNRLEDINAVVQPLNKLKSLDITSNRLKGDLPFLRALPEITEIYLMNNALTDQELERVMEYLQTKNVTVK